MQFAALFWARVEEETAMVLRTVLVALISCLCSLSAANAAIVYSEAHPYGLGDAYAMDLNGDGVDEIEFRYVIRTTCDWPPSGQGGEFYGVPLGNSRILCGGDYIAAPLPNGALISAMLEQGNTWAQYGTIAWWDMDLRLGTYSGWLGLRGALNEAYIGCRFEDDDGLHYAWVHAVLSEFGAGVEDWAYEATPGAPIAAGAVPEPATVALLIAVLAVGARLRRIR
jgi:hypothetical protein